MQVRMKSAGSQWTWVFLLGVPTFGVQQAHAAPSLPQLRQMELHVRSVLSEQDSQRAARILTSQFGMGEFARRCLVDYWSDLDAMQQHQYVFLFTRLMQKNLEARFKNFSEIHLNYRQKFLHMHRNDDGTWTARARFESPDYTGTAEYVFADSKGRLELVDYVLDGVSLSRNYRGRFNNIMRNRGYAGLLADLNAKLEQVAALQPR